MSCRRSFGQPVVVENRTGAGGVIGTLEAAKSPPDGYTLLMMSNTQTANESLLSPQQRKYELMRDLVPIAPVNYFRSRHRRAPVSRGQDAAGVHRAGEIAAGKAELRLVRPGHALSHGRRAVQIHGRHRCGACSLPQQRRGAQRRHRRTGADDDRRGDRRWPPTSPRARCGRSPPPARRVRACCPMCRPPAKPACPATRRPSGSD